MSTPIAASSIVAQAFRYMEITPPSSFDDDSAQAEAAAEQYPNAMLQCLEVADWSFASKLVFLPPALLPLTVTVDPDLPHSFTLPGDLVRIQEVGSLGVRWRRDMDALRADDEGPLRLRYTAAIENETSLPATFRMAVSLALALLLAPRWMPVQSKIQELEAQLGQTLKQAMRQDARMASEARYDGLPDQPDWADEARL